MRMVVLKLTNVEVSIPFTDLALPREIVYSIWAFSIRFYKYAKDLGSFLITVIKTLMHKPEVCDILVTIIKNKCRNRHCPTRFLIRVIF